jgi:polar amino acid transport system ATP-binding protein
MSELMISVRNLHKSFGTNAVLTDISIDIFSQEVVVVIGPSGSGKSTFLRCLNSLEHPQSGENVIEGTSLMETKINDIRTELGMVFQ